MLGGQSRKRSSIPRKNHGVRKHHCQFRARISVTYEPQFTIDVAVLPPACGAVASNTRTVFPATSTLGRIRHAQRRHNHRNTILCWVAPAVLAISRSRRKSFPSSDECQPEHEGLAHLVNIT